MLLKLLILTGAVSFLGMFIFRAFRGAMGVSDSDRNDNRPPASSAKIKDLVKCPRCGIFLPSDRTCDCEDAA